MKLLIYGINYYPELTGIGKYTEEMSSWLAKQGHHVEVITAMPFYPDWKVHQEYAGKGWHTEVINGVKVHRVPLYVPEKVTGKTRILHEISFGIMSLYYWFLCFFKKYDVIISPCPPLQIGIYPWLYTIFHRNTKWIFHIQDLQVDAAKDLGLIKNKTLLSILEKIERFFLKKAIVSSISEGMIQKIASKGVVTKDEVIFFPNWTDKSHIKPLSNKRAFLKQKYGFSPEKKLFLYSGNIGKKQGLDEILYAAKQLQDKNNEDVAFFIVGNGASKLEIVALAEKMQLRNVTFSNLVPLSELTELLNSADFHMILQKSGATDLVMPSKLTNILAVGGICIATADIYSNLRLLIDKYNVGFTADAEKTDALVDIIQQALTTDAQIIKEKSENSINYADEFLDKENILTNFERTLLELSNK